MSNQSIGKPIPKSIQIETPNPCRAFVSTIANKNLAFSHAIQALCRSNKTIVLAAITLVALLVGWIGGSMTQLLPQSTVIICALIAYAAGGYTGLLGAVEQARAGKFDIDFLMITAAIGAAAIGEWEEGALLLFLFTLSGGLEEFALDRTRHAIEALTDLRPDTALVRRDGTEVTVGVESLRIGETVLVHPGERLPVDGLVSGGTTTIDQSPITGESVPVHKTIGNQVYAGTINGNGALEVEVNKLASDSAMSKIVQLVEEARQDAAPTQRFIDRFSQPYTYAVIGATLLTILIPQLFSSEPFQATIYRAMTLLVVASPCALIISTPASILSAIASAARAGVLFKGGAYLEKMAQISGIAFDKTGTVTQGNQVVTELIALGQYDETTLLQMAASAELPSEHHIAEAMIAKARQLGLSLERPTAFRAIIGHGVEADFERETDVETIYIGNDKLFARNSMQLSAETEAIRHGLKKRGATAMFVARRKTPRGATGVRDWDAVGLIGVADTVRPEAAAAIATLRTQGIAPIMLLTGDNREVAAGIAAEVGIDTVYSDLLPEEKVDILRDLVADQNIAMVGDGVNDAPALTTASIGIAMGVDGTDVALESADVVLMSSDLSTLPFALQLSRKAEQIVRQNIFFSISVIALLVFATIIVPLFYPAFSLPLPLGVVGHEGSTLIVVMNGLRLLTMGPHPQGRDLG